MTEYIGEILNPQKKLQKISANIKNLLFFGHSFTENKILMEKSFPQIWWNSVKKHHNGESGAIHN